MPGTCCPWGRGRLVVPLRRGHKTTGQAGLKKTCAEMATIQFMSVRLYACFYLSVCLPACLPAFLSVCLSVWVPVGLSVCLSVCLLACLHCLPVWLPVGLLVCLAGCAFQVSALGRGKALSRAGQGLEGSSQWELSEGRFPSCPSRSSLLLESFTASSPCATGPEGSFL